MKLGGDILKVCVENGGVLSGEHGIGYEKRDYMPLLFSETDLNNMKMLKNIFDPEGLFNPGKIFPAEWVKLKITNDHKIINNHYPDSKKEFSRIVNELYQNKQKMIILGGATKTQYENPYNSVHNVFTCELNKVIDYNPSEEFLLNIRKTAEEQKTFKSGHKYNLEKFGLTEDRIRNDCSAIYNTFLNWYYEKVFNHIICNNISINC